MKYTINRFRLILLPAILAAFAALQLKFGAAGDAAGFAFAAEPAALQAGSLPHYQKRFASGEATPSVHSAAAIAVNDGIRGFWYGGSREGARDTAIYTTRYSSLTSAWGPERAIFTRESTQQHLRRYIRKLGNAAVLRDARGRLRLFYVSVSVGGWSGSAINTAVSRDEGRTWSAPRRLVTSPFFNLSTLVKGRPFLFEDGSIGLPVYHEFLGKFGELLRLDNDGKVLAKTRLSWGRHSLQPVIVVQSPTEAAGFMRYCGKEAGRVLMFSSDDGGRTWTTPAPLSLPNPNAAVDAVGMGDDDLLLVFNNRETDRDDLSLAFSSDDGRTWKDVHSFIPLAAPPPGHRLEFSYPWLMFDDAGGFHLLYTWTRSHIKHVEFNRHWLEQQL